MGIYVFDRNYFAPAKGYQTPFYVKDTNDFVLRFIGKETWCISRDLSLFNVVMCVNQCASTFYCPNVQDYIKDEKSCWQYADWFTPSATIHADKSLKIECVGESIKTPNNPYDDLCSRYDCHF